MVIARIAGLRPGTSPPPVRIAIVPFELAMSSPWWLQRRELAQIASGPDEQHQQHCDRNHCTDSIEHGHDDTRYRELDRTREEHCGVQSNQDDAHFGGSEPAVAEAEF